MAAKYIDDAEKWGVIDSARWQRFYTWLNNQQLLENKIDPSAGLLVSTLDKQTTDITEGTAVEDPGEKDLGAAAACEPQQNAPRA